MGTDGNIQSYNLFSYCLNNPINRVDCFGNWSTWATIGIISGTILCIAAVTVLTCGVGTATLAGAIAVGAAKGVLIGAAAGTVCGAGIGYVSTGTIEGATNGASIGFGAGALAGAAAGGVTSGLTYGTFSSQAALADHYARHGNEFGDMYSSAKEYAKGAKYVVKTGTYIPEKNAYIKFIGMGGKANYAFVGMKAGGRVATYHIRDVAKLVKDGISMFTT